LTLGAENSSVHRSGPNPYEAVGEHFAVGEDVLLAVGFDVCDEQIHLLDDAAHVAHPNLVTDGVGLIEQEIGADGAGGEQVSEGDAAEEDDGEDVGGEEDDERPGGDANLAEGDECGQIEDAVRVMTTLLDTYGEAWADTMRPMEKADKIANILSTTVARFNTDLTKLSEGMKNAVPPAVALNVDLAELAATIGALQTKGMVGERAGSTYMAMLRGMTRLVDNAGKELDSADMSMEEWIASLQKGAKAKAKFNKIGQIRVADEAGNLLPIYEILAQFEKLYGTSGLKAEEAAELIQKLGDESSRGIQLLIGQSEALREATELIRTKNTLDAMVEARQKGINAQYQIFKERIKTLGIAMGGNLLPTTQKLIRSANKALDDLFLMVQLYPDSSKWVAWGMLGSSAALMVGGALTSVTMLLKMYSAQMTIAAAAQHAMAGSAGSAAAASIGLRAALIPLLGTLGSVLVVLSGVAAAAWLLKSNTEKTKQFIEDLTGPWGEKDPNYKAPSLRERLRMFWQDISHPGAESVIKSNDAVPKPGWDDQYRVDQAEPKAEKSTRGQTPINQNFYISGGYSAAEIAREVERRIRLTDRLKAGGKL